MKFTWRTEWPFWALLAGMFALAALTWQQAPGRIPTHWGVNGEVNGYGGKFEGLLLIPLVSLAIYLLFLFIPRIDPARANYAQFAGAYNVFRFTIVLFLALMYGIIHLWIRGHRTPIETIAPMLVGGLLVVMGRVMGRLRPNWFVGIRTPWTLSSRRAWTKTHRVAGWVFTVVGLLFILAGAFHSTRFLIITIALMGVGILGTIACSYFVWRDDPDRDLLGGKLRAD